MATRSKSANLAGAFTLGRNAFAKISAVEGISLSGSIQRELEEFDRLGLSADDRREAVKAKFGKKRT